MKISASPQINQIQYRVVTHPTAYLMSLYLIPLGNPGVDSCVPKDMNHKAGGVYIVTITPCTDTQ